MANKYAEHSKAKRRRSSPGEIIRFRKCTLKQSFGTRADAEQVAAARGMRAYRCSFCKQFHLTSKPHPRGKDSERARALRAPDRRLRPQRRMHPRVQMLPLWGDAD